MVREPAGHFPAKCFALLFAHPVELVESFGEASRRDLFEAREVVVERRSRRLNHAGQAQDRGEVRVGRYAELLSQRADGLQIGCRDFFIHSDGGGPRDFVAQRHVEMPAADALADDLADARLERLEALRHAQMHVEKAVVHAADRDSQAKAIFSGVRLRIARH